ncbi:MAG: rRNA pseudouridine synthase [Bacteroidia bacterium]|nr:rRNA pseudouridine synthase [Bacteroidia bacterium]
MLSQFTPEAGNPSFADLHRKLPKAVYPVGRLDMNSEGLLLLTDDPELNATILRPEQKIRKTYLVLLDGKPDEGMKEKLSGTVTIRLKGSSYPCRFDSIEFLQSTPSVTSLDLPIKARSPGKLQWIRVTLTEGKNRQIRKMTATLNLPSLRIIRTSVGGITLGNLSPGEWKETSREDIIEYLYKPEI